MNARRSIRQALVAGATLGAHAIGGAVIGTPTRAAAQSPAARVGVSDGAMVLTYATRRDACGDGRDLVGLGDHVSGGDEISHVGRGTRRDRPCRPGPATVAFTARGGTIGDVRLRVGPPDAGTRVARTVRAADAAAYFLDAATRATGRDGEHAVIAAAIADSVEVWQPLLALAHRHGDDDVARAALRWLGAGAPPAAIPALAALLRDGDVRATRRQEGLVALAIAPGAIGEPALEAVARGTPGTLVADADAARMRDRAVFWLATTSDPRARTALRTLAAADTVPEAIRAQAIFALGHVDRRDDDPAPNATFLRGLYAALRSPMLQARTIQGVAQAEDPASRRWLLDLAADAGQPVAARRQALFWAGQQRDRPIADLLGLDARLTGAEIRRHYAFVLSQRDEDAAVDRLVTMARTDTDGGVRRQAIFWLGQSKRPRARAYLESVVAR